MNAYTSNITGAQAAQRIEAAKRIMVATHAKPDGDAAGAALAFTRALRTKGRNVDLFFMGPMEPALTPIIGETRWLSADRLPPADVYDLIVIVDTGAWAQLEPIAGFLRTRLDRILIVDHHPNGDVDAAMRLIDPTCASSTQAILPLLDELRCEVSGGIGGVAEALFVGLATDTGWFKYASADAAAFKAAARLLACGVDKPRLYQLIEENFDPRRLALEARALSSLEFAKQGIAAIQLLRPSDFEQTGGSVEDLTGLVNNPMTVGKVRVSILLSQTPDNQGSKSTGKPPLTKISFRSKPPPPNGSRNDFVDVNALAGKFGGGGHIHAAGARVNMNIDQAKGEVIAALD